VIIFQADRELGTQELDTVLARLNKAAEHSVMIVPPGWVIHDTATQHSYRYGQAPPARAYEPDLSVEPIKGVEFEASGGPSWWQRFRAWWEAKWCSFSS